VPDLNGAQAAVLKFTDAFKWSRASFCGPPGGEQLEGFRSPKGGSATPRSALGWDVMLGMASAIFHSLS